MPYANPEAQREYQRQWIANRRAEYLKGRSCVLCGSKEALEIDHANKTLKVSHRIWSWSRLRLEAELAKCVILCRRCHMERHGWERRSHGAGGYKRGCRCEVCCAWKAEARRRGPGQNRTGVSGFAGRRVNHSATGPGGVEASEPGQEVLGG